eukprot:903371-Ditylum_brightwellii.AAC.1
MPSSTKKPDSDGSRQDHGCGGCRGHDCGDRGNNSSGTEDTSATNVECPKAGESYTKVINGVTVTWCGRCANYMSDHSMHNNCKKCPHFKPKALQGQGQGQQPGTQPAVQSVITPTPMSG